MKLRSVLIALLLAFFVYGSARQACAEGDVVRFGQRIHVAENDVAGDVVCFFCSVQVDGRVNGDVVAFFGNVHVKGQAQHDLVDFFGRIHVEKDALVGEDLVSVLGSVQIGENASVGQDLVALFGFLNVAESAVVGGDRVILSGWLIGIPLLIVALIVFVLVREYRTYRRRLAVQGYPFPPRK
jgi:hypothetical protein